MFDGMNPFQQMYYNNMYRGYYREEMKVTDFQYATSPRWTEFENWMGGLSENAKKTPLYRLGIPGTHDSGTYQLFTDEIYDVNDFTGIAPTIAGPIIRAMAVTQSADIYTQLMEGNRYIDLRFARDSSGRIRIVHTVFGVEATIIFDQIKKFLDSHPKEIVIIDIQSINNLNENDQNTLRDIIKAKIGNRLAPREDLSTTSTPNNFYAMGKNAALIYVDSNTVNKEPLYWFRNNSTLQSPWYNTNDINYLIQKNNEGLYMLPQDRKFLFVSQMVLTINTSEIGSIILNLLKWLPIPVYGQIRFVQEFNKLVSTPGIYNLTAPHYGVIQNWIASHSPVDSQNPLSANTPNIIMLDFYQKTNINTTVRYNLAF